MRIVSLILINLPLLWYRLAQKWFKKSYSSLHFQGCKFKNGHFQGCPTNFILVLHRRDSTSTNEAKLPEKSENELILPQPSTSAPLSEVSSPPDETNLLFENGKSYTLLSSSSAKFHLSQSTEPTRVPLPTIP